MSTATAAKGIEGAEGTELGLHRKIDWTGAFWVASGVPALVRDGFCAAVARADQPARAAAPGAGGLMVRLTTGVLSAARKLGYARQLEDAGVTILEGVCETS